MNASYAGFDINAFFRGVGQRDVYPDKESAAFWGPYSKKYMVMPKFVGENIWTEDNPNAYFPRPQAYISTGSQDLSYAQTKYLQNAAYLRLKKFDDGVYFTKLFNKKITH